MKISSSLSVGLMLAGLISAQAAMASSNIRYEHDMPASCDNAQFQQDRQSYMQRYKHSSVSYGRHIELPEHVCGKVVRVFRARKSRSGWHGYFLLSVGEGKPLRIVSNLDEMNAPQWPWVKEGDEIETRGRFYFDSPRRQGLDWTHHGTSRKWPWGGFVNVNGEHYE
ncbi:hypothetical protein [Aristophania vespae]